MIMDMDWLDSIFELEKECFQTFYTLDMLKSCSESDSYQIFLFFLLDKQEKNMDKTLIFLVSHQGVQILNSKFLRKKQDINSLKFFSNDQKPFIIGYAIFLTLEDFSVELLRLGIRKILQNQGFGTYFLNKIIEYYFLERKNDKIFLEVSEENQKAIHLYKKLGFRNYAIRKKYYYHNQSSALCMVLEKKFYNLNQNK